MFHDIHWTSQKLQGRIDLIEPYVYRQRIQILPFRYRHLDSPLDPPPVGREVDDSSWVVVQPFEYWANPRSDFILRSTFRIPETMMGKNPIGLHLPIGIAGDFSHPEALVYIDGVAFAACDRHHQEIILPDVYCDGEEHSLALHGWTGIGGATLEEMTNKLKMNPCEVVQIDQPTRDFVVLARVALGIAGALEERDPVKHNLLTCLDEAFQDLDIRTPIGENLYKTIPGALKVLKSGIRKSGPALPVEITAIGHAHIDVAWLWTLGQTRQKAGRTFHNVLRLMEQFPDMIYAQSQPQLYDYVRQDFPDLFEAIKTRVKEGRWETVGGMWVEADCNLSGPESLARQFLLGRDFFREQFGTGVDSPVLWLPDVFGYAWNLPQLIKEAGLDYFFTIKIGWSQYNRLPYDSFWWQGLDGTKVLTHFSTTKEPNSPFAATYNSDASPGQVVGTWLNFQQKDNGPTGEVPPLLMSYGYGDGGGGPTRQMLENIREMGNFPGTPRTKPGKIVDFFKTLETFSDKLPTWNGELYLEYHRGTYTTQARNKRANRKSEFLLHDAEFLATYASLLDPNYEYPQSEFTKAWKLVCLNQFHDIIPGSSIAQVYVESLRQYEEIHQIVGEISKQALALISEKMGGGWLVANPTSFLRNEIIDLKEDLIEVDQLPPYSIRRLTVETTNDQLPTLYVSPTLLENEYVRVEFNGHGDLTRIYDKIAQREVLPEGATANQFQAFEDIPLSWDAWDIDIFYDDKVWFAEPATTVEVVENNPYRVSLRIERKILNSSYTQTISLSSKSARLDFDTRIDWQERRVLLKTAFPVELLSPLATYEIQWGNVERPTHRNTSWDWARFETAAQKWVDLSEGDYGVSLLNDCKYGHDIHDHVIRLTLLRGTTIPDPGADYGEHQFKYALFPHAGRWSSATVREAYALNDPLIVFQKDDENRRAEPAVQRPEPGFDSLPSLVVVDRSNIVIETIKRAEDGNGIIVRLYETQRQRGPFNLKAVFPMVAAWRANLLEENQEPIQVMERDLCYQIKPYQILTLRLIPSRDEKPDD